MPDWELTKGYRCPRISGEFYDCSMPLTFDQYKKCGYGCFYCFARYQRENNPHTKDYITNEVKSVNIDKVKKLFKGEYPDNPYYKHFIKKRKVLQWGSMADPFCPIEDEFGVGLELMKFFADIEYPIRFSTKGTLITENKKYWDFIKENADRLKDKWAFIYSIVTPNPKHAELIESGTPTPQERYKSLGKLQDLGYYTVHRLRPFLPGISNKGNALNKMLKKDKELGIDALSIEWFCLDRRVTRKQKEMYKKLGDIAGINYPDFYKRNSEVRGYERLNPAVKKPIIEKIYEYCKDNDIHFAISDPHFKELNDSGSCCGLPCDDSPLSNFQKSQWTKIIREAREHYLETGKKQKIKFEDIDKGDFDWEDDLKANSFIGFIDKKGDDQHKRETTKNNLKNRWNQPNKGSSPYKYFYGRLKPIRLDKNQDVVYQYNPSDLDKKHRADKK